MKTEEIFEVIILGVAIFFGGYVVFRSLSSNSELVIPIAILGVILSVIFSTIMWIKEEGVIVPLATWAGVVCLVWSIYSNYHDGKSVEAGIIFVTSIVLFNLAHWVDKRRNRRRQKKLDP